MHSVLDVLNIFKQVIQMFSLLATKPYYWPTLTLLHLCF